MEQQQIKVLVKLNEKSEIIEIGSSIFINDTDFIEIDEGFGDKFAHAQNQYLDKALTDEYGRFNYKYIGNIVTEVEHLPYVEPPKEPNEFEKMRADMDFVLMLNGEV